MSNRISKRLGYEQLEQRKLLAADLAADVMPGDMDFEPQVAHCEVAMDLADDSSMTDLATATVEGASAGDQLTPRIHELDLSDGSDGVFGTMDVSSNESTFSFQPENDGSVDIVVASSFGESSTFMEVRDSKGELISATTTEGLDSFHTLRIDVDGGEVYDLTVSTEEGVTGSYQVTVGFIADQESGSTISDHEDAIDYRPNANAAETEVTSIGDAHNDPQPELTPDGSNNPTDVSGSTDELVTAEPTEETVNCDSNPNGDSESDASTKSDTEMDQEPKFQPQPVPTPDANADHPTTVPSTDIHINEISNKSTELSMATGFAQMLGQLESAGDVDTFRFTPDFDGSMDLFLADITANCDLELNITVYDSNGKELLDGATNEVVQLAFDVDAGSEYYVSVSADEGQTGDYALIADFTLAPEPADDHVNAIGSEATELVFTDGSWTATGALETADDQDAFRFTANCSEPIMLAMDIDSANHQSAAQISVFDGNDELIVQGSTNDGVDLAFDTIEGVEYQILVDSINDIPMSFELTTNPVENSTTSGPDSELIEELIDDAVASCVDDLAGCGEEASSVDRIFADIGEESLQFDSSFDSMRSELDVGASRLLRFARRI